MNWEGKLQKSRNPKIQKLKVEIENRKFKNKENTVFKGGIWEKNEKRDYSLNFAYYSFYSYSIQYASIIWIKYYVKV